MLQPGEAFGHLLEEVFEVGAAGGVGGQFAQDVGEAGEDPAVAAGPEDLGAVGFFFGEVGVVAEEEVFIFVEEVVGGLFILAQQSLFPLGIFGIGKELGEDGRRHEERVAPGPALELLNHVVLHVAARRGADEEVIHHREGVGHLLRALVEAVQVDPGLGDALVVGEEAFVGTELPLLLLAELSQVGEVFGIRRGEGEVGEA